MRKFVNMEAKIKLILILLCLINFFNVQTVWGSDLSENNSPNAQEINVQGQITDTEGDPLIGVTVIIKGTNTGTITDNNGRYSLDNVSADATLVFSYVGFLSEEIPVEGRTVIDLVLMPDIKMLDELIVVGYGTQKKLDLTSAISSIDVDDLNSTPAINTETFIQGRTAGVFVASNTGAPGSSVSVKVRGVVTTGNSEPLYVVDGMPMASGGGDNKFGINSLNPNDIESIQILKDASSAAIYGSRGSNGVVLITTKRGKKGKPTINLNAYYGIQEQPRRIDVLDKQQYKQYYDLLGNAGPDYESFNDPELFEQLPDFDWQNEIFSMAPTSNLQFSISGGNENSTYMMSIGNNQQDGMVKGSDYNRSNFRINSDHNITKWLKFGESLSLSYSSRNRIREGGVGYNYPSAPVIITALLSDPTTKAYDENGEWNYMRHSGTFNGAGLRDRSNYNYTNKKLNGNVFFELYPVKNVTLKSSYGLDYNLGEMKEFMPSFEVEGSNLNEAQEVPTLKQSDVHHSYFIMENTANYNNTFGNHTIGVLGGFTVEKNDYYNLSGNNVISGNAEYLRYLDAGSDAETTRGIGGGASEWRMYSYLGRLNYAYDDKYLLTGSIRQDASSRFGPKNRTGIFPSVSAAWRLSNENFLNQLDWLSQLKIRIGWGQVGNQNNIGNYSYNTPIQPEANYVFGYNKEVDNGVTAGVINEGYGGKTGGKPGNKALTWETTETTNLGLDISLFNSKLNITTDYFVKDNVGMLMQSTVPNYLGITGPDINGGKIANKGFEFEASYRNYEGALNFELGMNMAYIHTEVMEMDNTKFSNGGVSRTIVGGGIADFWGLKTDGVFKSEEEVREGPFQNNGTKVGDIRYVDINKDGIIDENDHTVIGSPLPEMTYGFTGKLFYKDFDLNIFMQGVRGNEIYNKLYNVMMGPWGVNHHVDILDTWTQKNSNSDIPRFEETSQNNNQRWSDRWLEDGSYLRVKTVSLGYTLPSKWANIISVQNLRIYLTINNLYTFTNYKGFDPEIGKDVNWGKGGLDMGVDNGNYPMPRTTLMGINLSF